MNTSHPPKDGDFAKMLEQGAGAAAPQSIIADPEALLQAQVDRVLIQGQWHTPEELAQIEELETLPPLSDEELARQAEEAPGADGDASTPE